MLRALRPLCGPVEMAAVEVAVVLEGTLTIVLLNLCINLLSEKLVKNGF